MNESDKYARQPPSLPAEFRKHSIWFIGALLAGSLVGALPEGGGAEFLALRVLLMVPAWGITVAYIGYYLIAFPVIHAGLRHRGPSQSLWLGWLAVETIGLAFPFVRIAYFFTHILPDIRAAGDYQRPRNHPNFPMPPRQPSSSPA